MVTYATLVTFGLATFGDIPSGGIGDIRSAALATFDLATLATFNQATLATFDLAALILAGSDMIMVKECVGRVYDHDVWLTDLWGAS